MARLRDRPSAAFGAIATGSRRRPYHGLAKCSECRPRLLQQRKVGGERRFPFAREHVRTSDRLLGPLDEPDVGIVEVSCASLQNSFVCLLQMGLQLVMQSPDADSKELGRRLSAAVDRLQRAKNV